MLSRYRLGISLLCCRVAFRIYNLYGMSTDQSEYMLVVNILCGQANECTHQHSLGYTHEWESQFSGWDAPRTTDTISVMTHFSRVLVSAPNQFKIVEMKITDNIIIKLVLCMASGHKQKLPTLLAQSPASNWISKGFQESRNPSSFPHGQPRD